MSDFIFMIDGKEVPAEQGQTILEAAEKAGIYIPRLCAHHELVPHGSCRVCTVRANGRPQAACVTPALPHMMVESETEEILDTRKMLVEMLFVEGNHICPCCEKSGNCELQAVAYRLGIAAPRFPFLFPDRKVDASHDVVFIDHNRCILCGRCVRASRDLDGKHVFEFVDRSIDKRVAFNAEANLAETELATTDKAVDICPVGAILRKHVGFSTPVGQRAFDEAPIGSEVEQNPSTESQS